MFRILNKNEEIEFRNWARLNYKPFDKIEIGFWHPVVIDECLKINIENAPDINNYITN